MTVLDEFFDPETLRQQISALSSTNPFPGESVIRDAFSASRMDQHFFGNHSRKYPQIDSMRAFRSKMCDLRAGASVWVEFKHGTSRRYIEELGFDEYSGTTKDLFRNACMDLTKVSLINREEDLTGLVIISVLHIGESQDISFANIRAELEALADVFKITPERRDFAYPAKEGDQTVNGVLTVFTFAKPALSPANQDNIPG